MANLGTLTLDLIAKVGGFVAGLDKAERASAKSAKEIERNLLSINATASAIGNTLGTYITRSIDAIAAAFPAAIEQAAQFQDIAEKTGASAEGFAAMAVSAKVGGVSMDELANASIKLTKNLTGVDDESKAAGAALTALGIPIAEFKKLAPEQQFKTFAEALEKFRDGTAKTAVATAALGKSGAELLPFFKELAQAQGLQKILSEEQIQKADEYLDRQTRLRAELSLYASAIATQFIGPMNEVIRITIDVVKELGGFNRSISDVASNNGVKTFAENAAVALVSFVEAISNAVAAIGTLLRGAQLLGTNLRLAAEGASFVVSGGLVGTEGIKNAYKNNIDAYEKLSGSFNGVIDRAKTSEGKKLRELFDQQNQMAAYKPRRPIPPKPELVFDGAITPPKRGGGRKAGGGGAAADDPTKKLLENELANFKAMGDQAKEQLADRNKILDLYNQQGLLSVQDYYAGLKAAQDDALAGQVKAIDEQIAALQKFKAAAKKDTDVADTQGKINKLEEEKAKLYRQSGNAALESSFKQTQAQKAVQDAVNEVNAKLLEFNGNMREAAAIRFDAQNEKTRQMFTAEGNAEAAKALDTLRAYTLAQADLNKAQQQFSLAQGDLQIAEERITIARERGTMGEIESLHASGEARQRAVALMEKHLAVLLSINEAARSPEQTQAIERLKVQLEGLKATIDPLADKFNTLIGDAAGNAFGDFLTRTKTAKEAFKDFSNTVINEITRMIAKDWAKKLFSGDGEGGGFNIGSMLSKLFGGATTGGISGTAKSAAEKSANATGGDDILGSFLGALGLGGAGAGGAAGATGAAASTTALATSATAATAAISALATAAAAAAAAMGASGATSVVGSLGSLASSLAGANAVGASGGDALGALIKMQGWAGGGFTGMGAANDPAGIVHRGEYVLDQQTTKRLGVASLNRLNNGGTVGGGFTQNVNVTVGGTPTRKTPTHIAQEVRRQTVTAAARF